MADSVAKYGRGQTIFVQGEASEDVLYVLDGGVKLSVLSQGGREAVVGLLGPGDFFGEGCLAGQRVRMGNASAITSSAIAIVAKGRMLQLLRTEHSVAGRFIAHMLWRNIRIEEDLINQLLNSPDKRRPLTINRALNVVL